LVVAWCVGKSVLMHLFAALATAVARLGIDGRLNRTVLGKVV